MSKGLCQSKINLDVCLIEMLQVLYWQGERSKTCEEVSRLIQYLGPVSIYFFLLT